MTDTERLERGVEGLVHADTQIAEGRAHLTVDAVYEHVGPGRVDFGGDELEPATVSRLELRRRDSDDEYGWWNLEPGNYLVEYNERLVDDGRYWLSTRRAVLERGAFHPTLLVDDLGRVPIAVGNGGISIKENARISALRPR